MFVVAGPPVRRLWRAIVTHGRTHITPILSHFRTRLADPAVIITVKLIIRFLVYTSPVTAPRHPPVEPHVLNAFGGSGWVAALTLFWPQLTQRPGGVAGSTDGCAGLGVEVGEI